MRGMAFLVLGVVSVNNCHSLDLDRVALGVSAGGEALGEFAGISLSANVRQI